MMKYISTTKKDAYGLEQVYITVWKNFRHKVFIGMFVRGKKQRWREQFGLMREIEAGVGADKDKSIKTLRGEYLVGLLVNNAYSLSGVLVSV